MFVIQKRYPKRTMLNLRKILKQAAVARMAFRMRA